MFIFKTEKKSRKKMKKISDKNKLKPCGRCAATAFKNFSFLILILSSRKATLRTVSSHGLNFGSEVRNIDCIWFVYKYWLAKFDFSTKNLSYIPKVTSIVSLGLALEIVIN